MAAAPVSFHNLVHRPLNPAPVTGLLTRASERYELKWSAGEDGHPGINADLASGTEATREPVSRSFEVLGTNGTSALSTYYAEGGITFTTAGANDDQMILLPHLDTKQTAWSQVTWGTDKQTEWACNISTAASVALVTLWAGLKLTNTSVVATDNDQAFFRVTAAGNWSAIYSIGGTDTTVDTGVAVAASTKYRLGIAIDSSRIARFYINDELVATSTALTDATDLIPYIGVHANTGSAKAMNIHFQSISRSIG